MTPERPGIFDSLLIGAFALLVCAPLLFWNRSDLSPVEKRQLAVFPKWPRDRNGLDRFLNRYQQYFNDHYGFRERLAQAFHLSRFAVGSSGLEEVIVGREGWLYYAGTVDQDSLRDFRRADPLTPAKLAAWQGTIETRHAWLAERGVPYLFMVAPDKHTIYPEHYPARIRPVGAHTRLDQLVACMAGSDAAFLDLRRLLLEAKTIAQVYYKTDSHWNDFGASLATAEMVRWADRYFPQLQPPDPAPKDFIWREREGGDLAQMLNLSRVLTEPSAPHPIHPEEDCEDIPRAEKPPRLPGSVTVVSCEGKIGGPVAMILHDSFFLHMEPFVTPHFARTVMVYDQPTPAEFRALVERYAPDLVVEERVERSLPVPPPLQ